MKMIMFHYMHPVVETSNGSFKKECIDSTEEFNITGLEDNDNIIY